MFLVQPLAYQLVISVLNRGVKAHVMVVVLISRYVNLELRPRGPIGSHGMFTLTYYFYSCTSCISDMQESMYSLVWWGFPNS